MVLGNFFIQNMMEITIFFNVIFESQIGTIANNKYNFIDCIFNSNKSHKYGYGYIQLMLSLIVVLLKAI